MVKPQEKITDFSPQEVNFDAVEWRVSGGLTDYQEAVAVMNERAAAIRDGRAGEYVWLVEHPPTYTAGTSAKEHDLLTPDRFPVIRTGRGGQYTYHGPGQRVAYVMLDLTKRGKDIRAFVCNLESWIIETLSELGVTGERRPGRVGVWVRRPELGEAREDKIAAIGVRVRRWVTFHGISLNIDPDLEHYSGIVPCGVAGHGVTSLSQLGIKASTGDVDQILKRTFSATFGRQLREA